MIKIINTKNYNIENIKNEIKNQDFFIQNSIESIVWKYEIYKNFWFLPEKDLEWKPICNNGLFWSISHKKDLVFIWVYNKQIWVDIEIIKDRWEEIYFLHNDDEYKKIWWKNLENFYKLWTIKESIIKLNLDEIGNLNIIEIIKIKNETNIIDNILFQTTIFSIFKNKKIITYNWKNKNMIYSISFLKKDLTF